MSLHRARRLGGAGLVCLIAIGAATLAQRSLRSATDFSGHNAVGSWFGKAIQICESGVSPSACAQGRPPVVLFMTPTLLPDGLFVADDSMTLGGPPFGPHTTAHGQWLPTSSTGFTADYAFMLRAFPPPVGEESITAVRCRWSGQVVDRDTLVGWVNVYTQPVIPLSWVRLLGNEYPPFPEAAKGVVTSPTGFTNDPAACRTQGCPLIFKFTIKRIAP